MTNFAKGTMARDAGSYLFRKQCKCHGTSSGPRVGIETKRIGDTLRITATYAAFVCDTCDRAWGKE